MRSLEGYRPRGGLSVPVVTALDAAGRFDEAAQRRLLRHVVSEGFGADIVFAGGTTGEALALSRDAREGLVEACVDELRGLNRDLDRPVELWAGVTMRSRSGTLGLLRHAAAAGADAAVLAPLSIEDLEDIPAFFHREVRDVLEGSGRMIPVFLYDNADIATAPGAHLRTALVKRLSRMEFVRGIKVSAPMSVLGNYTKAAGHFHARGAFGIYTGNAALVFEIFDVEKGPFRRHLDRFLLNGSLPVGVVAGQANALPREWQNAWRVAVAGDDREASRYREAFRRLSAACRPGGSSSRTIACMKRVLERSGILSSDRLAPGTAGLSLAEGPAFDAAFESVARGLREGSTARWTTPWPEGAKA